MKTNRSLAIKPKSAELSETTIAIIIVLVIIFIGLAIFFSRAKDFKASLGI